MRRVLLIVLSALLMSLLPGVPAQAAVEEGATFNVPRPWGTSAQKYRNINKVVRAIDQVPAVGQSVADPDPVVLISSYLFDHQGSAEALVGACKRGISVRVVLDGDIDNRTSRYLITALNGDNTVNDRNKPQQAKTGPCGEGEPTAPPIEAPLSAKELDEANDVGVDELDTPLLSEDDAVASALAVDDSAATWGADQSYVTRCVGSCRGGRSGNMHTKVYAFSSTDNVDDVMMVSSANLNRGGAALGWNDMYTMREVPRTWSFFRRIHREMTADRNYDTSSVSANTVVEKGYVNRFFPIDNAGKAKDPTLQDLNKIRCRSSFGRTKLFISMFYWAGTRGDYIADKLLNLARNGCRVSIIYGAPGIEIAARLRKAAKARLINLFDSRWDFNNDGYNEIRTHSKYVAIKGTFGGDSSAHMVLTGSQNWVAGSLSRGDESSLNIAKASAYSDYVANWAQIRNHSRRLPYNR